MKKELTDKIYQLRQEHAEEGFVILGVFGSCARNEETPESDVDILKYILPEVVYV